MEQIEVRILDRSFKLQVAPAEKQRLMEAVTMVDRKMREIQTAGRGALSIDRVAVNAALQLAFEFLGSDRGMRESNDAESTAEIRRLTRKAEEVLQRNGSLF